MICTIFLRMKYFLYFLGTLFFVLIMILSHKNTGYLCALFSIAFMLKYFYWNLRSVPKIKRMLSYLFVITSVFIICSFIAIAFLFFKEYLPSGSPSVRLITYFQRFTMFLESPIWGTLFMGSPLVDIGSLRIPSHSDILDILAFGGFLGFFLFLFPFIRLFHFFKKRMDVVFEVRDDATVISLFVTCTFLIEMLFNPVWNQPKIATIFWCFAGCLFAQFTLWRDDVKE